MVLLEGWQIAFAVPGMFWVSGTNGTWVSGSTLVSAVLFVGLSRPLLDSG